MELKIIIKNKKQINTNLIYDFLSYQLLHPPQGQILSLITLESEYLMDLKILQ